MEQRKNNKSGGRAARRVHGGGGFDDGVKNADCADKQRAMAG
jgi:hypothetical protein